MHKSKISKISRAAADQNNKPHDVSSFDTWYDKYKLNDKNKYKITVYVYIQKQNNYIYILLIYERLQQNRTTIEVSDGYNTQR